MRTHRFAPLLALLLSGCSCSTTKKCADTQTDVHNCGQCGVACAAGSVCSAGACVEPCAGKNLQTDPQNCGTCGNACAAAQTCTAGTCLAPLAVSVTAPADHAHVPPRFDAALAVTGAADSLTLTLQGAPPLALTAAPVVHQTIDASAIADGATFTLTATVTQGARTAADVRTLVMDHGALNPVFTNLFTYYKSAATFTLAATVGGTATRMELSVGGSVVATATAPDAGGKWNFSLPAYSLGAGPVTLKLSATDPLGNSGFTTSPPVFIGLLPDSLPFFTTSEASQGSVFVDVQTPVEEAILYTPADVRAAHTAGELRYVAANGGTPRKLHGSACFGLDGSIEGRISADGSHLVFSAVPPVGTRRIGAVAAARCSSLYSTRLPPGAGDPQLLSANFTANGAPDLMVALDGTVAVWSEPAAGGGFSYAGGAIDPPAPHAIATGDTAITDEPLGAFPLLGAVVVANPGAPVNGSPGVLLVDQTGAHTVTAAAAPIATRPLTFRGRNDGSDFAVSADGKAAVLFAPSGQLYSLKNSAPAATVLVASASAPLVPWGGEKFAFNENATGPSTQIVHVADLATGADVQVADSVLGAASESYSQNQFIVPQDGSWLAIHSGKGPYTVDALRPDGSHHALTNPFTGVVTYPGALYASPLRPDTFNSARFTPFEDSSQASVYDGYDGFGRWITPVAGSPRRLDSDAVRSGTFTLLAPARQHLVFSDRSEARLFSWAMGAAPAVELVIPDAPSGSIVHGYTSSVIDTITDTQVVVAMAPPNASTARLYLARLDGTSVRRLTADSDADDVNLQTGYYGITADDSVVSWVSADQHLHAVSTAPGSVTQDLGTLRLYGVPVVLRGGVFLWETADASPKVQWLAWPGTAAQVIPGAADYENTNWTDDSRSRAFVAIDGNGYLFTSAGPQEISAGGAGHANIVVLPEAGLYSLSGGDGAIWTVPTSGAAAPLLLDPGSGSQATFAGQPAPPAATAAGMLSRQLFMPRGATNRETLYYSVSGGTRAGSYVIDTVPTP